MQLNKMNISDTIENDIQEPKEPTKAEWSLSKLEVHKYWVKWLSVYIILSFIIILIGNVSGYGSITNEIMIPAVTVYSSFWIFFAILMLKSFK